MSEKVYKFDGPGPEVSELRHAVREDITFSKRDNGWEVTGTSVYAGRVYPSILDILKEWPAGVVESHTVVQAVKYYRNKYPDGIKSLSRELQELIRYAEETHPKLTPYH